MLAGVDAGFLAEQRARSEARADRFTRDAAKPPPPLPTNRITVSEGKVAKNSQHDVMAAFIRRKLAAQLPLNSAVLEQARTLGIDVAALAKGWSQCWGSCQLCWE